MSINHFLSNVSDEEKLDVKFRNIVCNTITATGGGGGGGGNIEYLDKTYVGYDFVYDSVYSNILSQLYEARRVGSTFYLSCYLFFNRLPTYNGGNTYIYVPIPTSIKNILATEYPPINNNEIYFFVYNGDIVPLDHNGVYSNATSGVVKYDATGYEGTHLRIEYKDFNTTNKVLGQCDCRMDIRFAPKVTE